MTLESDFTGDLSDKLEALRLSDLGCKVLHQNSVRQSGIASSFWSFTLPQLGQSSPVVHAAAAALGAAIESRYFRRQPNSLSLMKHYGQAIRQIQDGISSDEAFSVPLVASCMVLAITDVLAAQDVHALSHLKGTLALLQKRQAAKANAYPSPPEDGSSDAASEDRDFAISDEIDAAAAILDVAAASYSLGMECHLPKLDVDSLSHASSNYSSLAALELRVLKTLHWTYNRAHHATHWKYVSQSLRPADMVSKQAEHIARLQQLIKEIGNALPALRSQQRARALVLRAQCTSTMIYASIVLDPYECSYDKFIDSFRSIIEDAAAVLQQRASEVRSEYTVDLLPDLGVIQPLYLTSSKCRHPLIRRKALYLLGRTGREGPFEGQRLAAVGRRAVAIEEILGRISAVELVESMPINQIVPESERIHGWGIDTTATAALANGEIMAFYCQCTDVDLMMQNTTYEAHKKDEFWSVWKERVSLTCDFSGVVEKPLRESITGRPNLIAYHGFPTPNSWTDGTIPGDTPDDSAASVQSTSVPSPGHPSGPGDREALLESEVVTHHYISWLRKTPASVKSGTLPDEILRRLGQEVDQLEDVVGIMPGSDVEDHPSYSD